MSTLLINAKKISALGVILSSFLISGQAFSAWGNDSPWSKKHAELKKQAAMEEMVMEAPVVETAEIEAEPAIIEAKLNPYFSEIPSVHEPVVVKAIEPVAEPVEVASQEEGILAVPGSHYAVQVYASSTTANLDKYKVNNGLEDLTAVKTDRNGAPVYVLVSLHDTRGGADEAALNLEQIIGSKPWVRSVRGLQAIVMK